MKKIEISIIALFVLVFSACNCRTKKCNLEVTLSMPDSVIVLGSNPSVEFIIMNNTSDTLLLPYRLSFQNYQASPLELYFEVEFQESDGEYQNISSQTADYDYSPSFAERINVAPNKAFKQEVAMHMICFDEKPGHYKMRAHFDLSEYIACRKFTSNWINFEIVDSASLFR